ncbi:MAG: hypothetical protein LBO66_03020 [Deltaproteobacteria bacterium]|nr:hypothetical protein [Deltaproteobacteria bacterium]
MSGERARAARGVKSLIFLCALAWGLGASWAWAQAPETPSLDNPQEREIIHLGAIGTFSAGFVLEAYGYIGVLADALHHGVYEPEVVRSMLGESQAFLRKALDKLKIYQDRKITVSPDDLKFINGVGEIISSLIAETESLSRYAQSFDKADYEAFKTARAKAWSLIKLYLGIK